MYKIIIIILTICFLPPAYADNINNTKKLEEVIEKFILENPEILDYYNVPEYSKNHILNSLSVESETGYGAVIRPILSTERDERRTDPTQAGVFKVVQCVGAFSSGTTQQETTQLNVVREVEETATTPIPTTETNVSDTTTQTTTSSTTQTNTTNNTSQQTTGQSDPPSNNNDSGGSGSEGSGGGGYGY